MNSLLRKFNVFTAAVAIFALMSVYCIYVYVMYDRPEPVTAGATAADAEMILPPIEWERYLVLSKKVNISTNNRVKRKVADIPGLPALPEPE